MKGNIDPIQLKTARELVGTWLREKRKAKGLSQAELADIMGVEHTTISKVEAGKWAISIDMLALFCEHLEYPLDEIFVIDQNQEVQK